MREHVIARLATTFYAENASWQLLFIIKKSHETTVIYKL